MSLLRFLKIALLIALLAGFLTTTPAPLAAQTSFDCSAVTGISQAECEAFVALYNATDGANWWVGGMHTSNDWLTNNAPCTWYGVTCAGGHVSELDLNSCGLGVGVLPPEFGDLTAMTALNLTDNFLTSLPPEFGNLASLTTLHLERNRLTALPPEFGNLANLTDLYLGQNNLTALPSQIGNLDNLRLLYLNENSLSTLPAQIGDLANLTTLYIAKNSLTALPAQIGELANLDTLYLAENALTTLPPQIGNLANLTNLYLGQNSLTALPPEIGNLANLFALRLEQNSLTALPPEIGNLSNLTYLGLGENALTTLPSQIGDLAKLDTLYLQENALAAVPPEIGNLANLTKLYLGQNNLTALPPQIGNLAKLSSLGVDDNALTSIPEETGNLPSLTFLDVSTNPLQGEVPFFLTQLGLFIFNFDETLWCAPATGPIREWLDNISSVSESGLICTYPPTTVSLSQAPALEVHSGAYFNAGVGPSNAATPITFTWNNGSIPPITHVRESLTDAVWLYWNTPGTHTVIVTATNAYSSVTAARTVTVLPVASTLVQPGSPASLTYTDGQGLTTVLNLPSNSVTATTALLYRPQPDPAVIPEWRPAGHNFTLDLYREGRPVANPTIAAPISLTIHYSEADIANVDHPAGLQLMQRNTNTAAWQPAACGPVSRDPAQRVISLPICQLGEFTLFGPAILTGFVEPTAPVRDGDTLTYTLIFSDTEGGALRIFDPITPTLEWQGFVGATPEDITFNGSAISGTVSLPTNQILTLRFTARVHLPESAFVEHHSTVTNTAYFCPVGSNPCVLRPSNTITNIALTAFVFLPIILRNR